MESCLIWNAVLFLLFVVSTCEWALLRPPRGAAGREFERWSRSRCWVSGWENRYSTGTPRCIWITSTSDGSSTASVCQKTSPQQVLKSVHTDMELKWESLLDLELMTGSWRWFLTTRGASISCRKVCMLMVWSGFLMGVLGHGSDRLDTALQCRNHRCACEEEGSTTLRRTTEDSFESHSRSRRIC